MDAEAGALPALSVAFLEFLLLGHPNSPSSNS